jgi:hypothetical protein
MRVAFGHVLPNLLSGFEVKSDDTAALPLDRKFQSDKERTGFWRQAQEMSLPVGSDKASHFGNAFGIIAARRRRVSICSF